jgi:hypothetical protein
MGPGPNDFSDSTQSVWLDEQQHLHLAIAKTDGRWRCAEVVADRSLGYGEYRWRISGDLAALDPRAVLGLFTYEREDQEVDFELSRWANPGNANAQFVVQPYTAKGAMRRFDTGKAKALTISIIWGKEAVRCRCWEGTDTSKPPLATWKYTGRHNPKPGKERARANLWLFQSRPPASGKKQEVVIESFDFMADERR